MMNTLSLAILWCLSLSYSSEADQCFILHSRYYHDVDQDEFQVPTLNTARYGGRMSATRPRMCLNRKYQQMFCFLLIKY